MASSNIRRGNDIDENELYSTPIEALESFYKAYPEVFDQYEVYLDPADGLGALSDFLESIGKKVYRYDLVDYRGKLEHQGDFLEIASIPEDVECIITNPPFTLTEKFVDKSLSLCSNLIMFNRATVLETKDRSRKHLTKEWPLKKFWSFGNRVSCTKGVDKKPTANAVWYGWFEYKTSYTGEPEIGWLFTK